MGANQFSRVIASNYRNMTFIRFIIAIILIQFIVLDSFAQNSTQTLRGNIYDQISQQPLAYVNIILNDSIASLSDENGEFRFEKLSIGKYKLAFQYIGYEEFTLRNIQLNSGKENVVNVHLVESIKEMVEVVVSANKEKAKPLNEMSLLSTRMVSVEETQRYAASFSDPARMANSFAGVVQTDAGNNHIAIRGNAPNGLLWRLEGVDIPNPNHFSYVSTSGGGISILSGQLLSNSDFSTGAFAAEYGNALSGVFDIKLRKGNNEKREYTFQLGALGIDAAAEGPFKKGGKSSYLINYRYSTLGLLAKVIDLGSAITTFQDLSYNFAFKSKKWGDLTMFGLNGLSSQVASDTTFKAKTEFVSNTFVNGLTHSKTIGSKSFLRSALVYSNTENKLDQTADDFGNSINQYIVYNESHKHNKITLSTKFQYKFSPATSFKFGVIHSELFYKLNQSSKADSLSKPITLFKQDGTTSASQIYAQVQHKMSEKFTANFGVHYLYNWLNDTKSIEPRAALQYSPRQGQNITLGYGLHSQLLPLSAYFVELEKNDKIQLVNKNLKMSKAHHIVLGYNIQPTSLINIKAEAYYQALFNIPQGLVKKDNISLVNLEFGTPNIELENKGIGRNYGVELTLEKYLNHGLYFTLSNSLYDAKFKGTDGNWYNSRFNGNFATTFTGGKEISISKKKNRSLAINVKAIYTGGLRQNNIDLNESIAQKTTIYDTTNPYNIQMKNFLRTDLKLIFKRNFKHITSSLIFDIQNIGDVKNVNGQYFNPSTKKVENYTQVGLLPVISYKLEF